MSDVAYGISEWRTSYEQAEIAEWDAKSSDLQDWPIAQWMCGLVQTDETVKKDPEIMEAAINLLDEEGHNDGFSPEFFSKVLRSEKGKTGSSFEELCWEHADENYNPGEPGDPRQEFESFVTDDDFESWYRNNVMLSHEVCAEPSVGGTLFWFNKDRW